MHKFAPLIIKYQLREMALMARTKLIREVRVRLSEPDYVLLNKKAKELELLPSAYARSLMLRLLRFEQTSDHRNEEGAA